MKVSSTIKLVTAFLVVSSVFVSQPLQANDFDITPLYGYRISDSLAKTTVFGESIKPEETTTIGFVLGIDKNSASQYEFLFSSQDTRLVTNTLVPTPTLGLTIDYYHFGGTTIFKGGDLKPFVSGGLGVTHISPDGNLSSETKFSLSIGGGIKVPLSHQIGLRFEGRGFGTVVNSSSGIFCSGGCSASFSGDMYLQFEAFMGVSVAF